MATIDRQGRVGRPALVDMDASALANALASGVVSAREVVSAHLEQIGTVNSDLNALTRVCDESALAAADLADHALVHGRSVGPLHGVPFTVKSNIDAVGLPTSSGMASGALPSMDAPVVAHLRRSGAILIGQTNMPDLGIRWHTHSSGAGATKNPWAPTLTPGGSSGGAAVACAAGMAPINLGNDGGGSIRYPAACCGVVGLRPTRGRIPLASTTGADRNIVKQLVNVEGMITRSVRDIELLLPIMSRASAMDPDHCPAPLRGPAEVSTQKVGVIGVGGDEPLDANVARNLEGCATILKECGYVVESVECDLRDFLLVWASMARRGIEHSDTENLRGLGESSRDFIQRFVDVVDHLGARLSLWDALTERHNLAARMSTMMSRYSVLLMPVSGRPPFMIDADLDEGLLPEIVLAQRFLVAANVLGWPSLTVPVEIGDVPIGVQIMSGPFREDRCIAVAQALAENLRKSGSSLGTRRPHTLR